MVISERSWLDYLMKTSLKEAPIENKTIVIDHSGEITIETDILLTHLKQNLDIFK